MNLLKADPPRVLFLYSDTGGGHRSAAEAIIEAIHLEFGDQLATSMIDFFRDYAPFPFRKFPEYYPHMVKVPQAWGLGFHLSDGHNRARLLTGSAWIYVRKAVHRMVAWNPCDLIVSVHPLATAPVLKALGSDRPPFTVVVTDLVTTHALWYHHRADLTIVPTPQAFQRALKFNMPPQRLRLVGLPVTDRFCRTRGARDEIRARLGWPQDRPMILLVGGGDGIGPLERTAQAIDAAGLPTGLAVVTGRNRSLQTHLESLSWSRPAFIYGFVRDMPDLMAAANILVTKAGPGTISEALNAGLPMILYSHLPGQEDGNIRYVVEEGAGVWAPKPPQIVATLHRWLADPTAQAERVAACRRLARPSAAREIAHILARQVGVPVIN